MYLSVVLTALMLGFEDSLTEGWELLLIWGTSIGLTLAHVFAFRVALVYEHGIPFTIGWRPIRAMFLVAVGVGVVASIPYLEVVDIATRSVVARWILTVVVAVAAYLAGPELGFATGRTPAWLIGVPRCRFMGPWMGFRPSMVLSLGMDGQPPGGPRLIYAQRAVDFGSCMRVLAVTNSWTGGDWPPVVHLALALEERGHEVYLIGDRPVLDAVSRSGIVGVEWPEDLSFTRFFHVAEEAPPGDSFARMCGAWADASGSFGADVIRRSGAQVLLGQMFCSRPASAFAKAAKLPWVYVNPAYYLGPAPARPMSLDWEKPVDVERGFVPAIEQADLVVHATDPVFDLVPPNLPTNHHYIGPLLWTPTADVPAYLHDDGPPWALVTLSSDFGRSDSVFVEPFVPHDRVLKNAVLFLSHGGHGAVMRAISHGVPMVIVPWGRDQPGTAYRAERIGVAKTVTRAELSKTCLSTAIDAALTEPGIAAATRKASLRVAAMDPPGNGARLIESLIS